MRVNCRESCTLLPPVVPSRPHCCALGPEPPAQSVSTRLWHQAGRRAHLGKAGGVWGTDGPLLMVLTICGERWWVPALDVPPPSTGRAQQGPRPICVAASVSLPGHINDPDCPGHRRGPRRPSAAHQERLHLNRPTHCVQDPASRESRPQTPPRGVSACLSLAVCPWGHPCPSLPPAGMRGHTRARGGLGCALWTDSE